MSEEQQSTTSAAESRTLAPPKGLVNGDLSIRTLPRQPESNDNDPALCKCEHRSRLPSALCTRALEDVCSRDLRAIIHST